MEFEQCSKQNQDSRNRQKSDDATDADSRTKRRFHQIAIGVYCFFFLIGVYLLGSSFLQFREYNRIWEKIESEETREQIDEIVQDSRFFNELSLSWEKGRWEFDSEKLRTVVVPVSCPRSFELIAYRSDEKSECFFLQKKPDASERFALPQTIDYWRNDGWNLQKSSLGETSSSNTLAEKNFQFELERGEKRCSVFLTTDAENIDQLIFLTNK